VDTKQVTIVQKASTTQITRHVSEVCWRSPLCSFWVGVYCCDMLSAIDHSQMVILRNNISGLIFAWKSGKLHSRIWKLCLLLWPRKQTAIISMNEPDFSTSEESKASHVEPQEHVGDFFWLWGHCSSEICSYRPNSYPALLLWGFDKNTQNDGRTTNVWLTMTMLAHTVITPEIFGY
jgi:hypothetical protein